MSIATALECFRDRLHRQVGVPVFLGRPLEGAPGLYLFPWRLVESAAARNVAQPKMPRAPSAPLEIHVLVLSSSPLTLDALTHVDGARQAIHENPIVRTADGEVEVHMDMLPAESLTAVFVAAGIPLTLCLTCVLRSAR